MTTSTIENRESVQAMATEKAEPPKKAKVRSPDLAMGIATFWGNQDELGRPHCSGGL